MATTQRKWVSILLLIFTFSNGLVAATGHAFADTCPSDVSAREHHHPCADVINPNDYEHHHNVTDCCNGHCSGLADSMLDTAFAAPLPPRSEGLSPVQFSVSAAHKSSLYKPPIQVHA